MSGAINPVIAVPVVPNFTQGSMTTHTETTSTVKETINSMDYATGWTTSRRVSRISKGFYILKIISLILPRFKGQRLLCFMPNARVRLRSDATTNSPLRYGR